MLKYNIMNNKLYIGLDSFDLNTISNVYVNTIPIGYEKVLVDEELDYSSIKGFLGYALLDDPIGLLGGLKVKETYAKISKEIIQLVITTNNKDKRYNLGTFHVLDDNYDICLEEGNRMCEAILSDVKNSNNKVNDKAYVEVNKDENIFIRILKWYINFIVIATILMFKGMWYITVLSLKVCWAFIKFSLFFTFGMFYYMVKGK